MPQAAFYGEIPGIPEGSAFRGRAELSATRVHRPLQAGICGTSKAGGAESIVISGGYEDDKDYGGVIIYTGHGSNDPKTGNQTGDQVLGPGNAALAASQATGNPIRVIRGAHLNSEFAPETGYRYDGLYRVEGTWWERGRRGFVVFQCRLVKIKDEQSTESYPGVDTTLPGLYVREAPKRIQQTIQRIVRNTEVGAAVKRLYHHTCQRCGKSIIVNGTPYAECAHIEPLGKPHEGSDDLANVLCLCPNCHVEFDLLGWHLTDGLKIVPDSTQLNVSRQHKLSAEAIRFRRKMASGGE